MGNKVNVWLVSFIACLTKVIFAIDGFRLLTANLYHEILKRVDLSRGTFIVSSRAYNWLVHFEPHRRWSLIGSVNVVNVVSCSFSSPLWVNDERDQS